MYLQRRRSIHEEAPTAELPHQDDDFMEVVSSDPQQDFTMERQLKVPHQKKRKLDDLVAVVGSPIATLPEVKMGQGIKITNLPVEIRLEIFGHLDPIDLLYLARAEKSLRALLMSRSAQMTWKAARTNVEGLPPCPEDLSEPQYADLVFCTYCSSCLDDQNDVLHSWDTRLRVCHTCVKHYFGSCTGLPSFNLLQPYLPTITVVQGRDKKVLVHLETYRKWADEHGTATPYPSIQENFKRFSSMVRSRNKFVEHGKLCIEWVNKRAEKREKERLQAISDRKDLVLQKLLSMGWEDEINKQGVEAVKTSFLRSSSIKCALQQVLTDRILQKMESRLIKIMVTMKDERLKAERKRTIHLLATAFQEVYFQCVASLPRNTVYPPATEVFFHPRIFERLIALGDIALASGANLPLDFVDEEFSIICSEWEEASKNKLVQLILDAVNAGSTRSNVEDLLAVFDLDHGLSLDVLDSALVQFRCCCCNGIGSYMHWKQALMHRCKRWYTSLLPSLPGIDPEEELDVRRVMKDGSWGTENVSFHCDSISCVHRIKMICGFGAEEMTHHDMDERAPILECLRCNDLSIGRLTLKWDSVYRHFSEHTGPVWVMASQLRPLEEAESCKVRQAMKEDQERKYSQVVQDITGNPWCCRVDNCQEKGPLTKVKRHIMTVHNKDPEDEDLALDLATSPLYEPYRLWPPRLTG